MRSIHLHTTNEHVRGNRVERQVAGETVRAKAYKSSLFLRAIRAAVAMAVGPMRVDRRLPAAPMPAPATFGSRLGRLANLAATIVALDAKRLTAGQQGCWSPVLCSSAVRS